MEPPQTRETPPAMAGAQLRAARESAGMTIDAVAQQLKLAPRQVKAIEDGDFKELPGRTFIRGFVRNYARLVHLDPERVVSALPGGASAPALEAPALSPTAHTMGELPTTERARTPWARWAIPGVLAAIVAVAAVYEWMRPPGESHFAAIAPAPHSTAQKEAATQAAAPSAAAPSPPSTPEGASTPLPNPVIANVPAADSAQPKSDSSAAAAPAPSVAATVSPAAPEARRATAAPSAATAAMQPAPASTPSSAGAAPVAGQTIVVAFRNNSWTEIRDREGRVLITGLNRAGTAQTVTGAPPFTITIGNANDVTLRYKGERVDLAPYTQKNVARLTLR